MSDVTVVLLHGGWKGPWCWEAVEAELAAAGVRAETIALPSTGEDPEQLGDLRGDVDVTRRHLASIEGPIVIVAHSYGGIVASEAALGIDNVEHIVYIASFLLEEGESLLGIAGGEPPESWKVSADGGSILPSDSSVLWEDCTPEVAAKAAARIQPLSMAAVSQGAGGTAWRELPTTYVVCTEDSFFPPELQEQMASRATRQVALATGHSPFLSKPQEVTETIQRVVAETVA